RARSFALWGSGAVRPRLAAVFSGGVVSYVEGGGDPVWLIGPEHQLAATFYRNSLIHFLLDTALCELAVLRAGESASDPASAPDPVSAPDPADVPDPVGAFWDEIARLRDL